MNDPEEIKERKEREKQRRDARRNKRPKDGRTTEDEVAPINFPPKYNKYK